MSLPLGFISMYDFPDSLQEKIDSASMKDRGFYGVSVFGSSIYFCLVHSFPLFGFSDNVQISQDPPR